jgi:gliding motility-associated-like protein
VGDISTLTAIAGGGNGGPYTYTWTPAGTGGNTPTVAVSPLVQTNYTVTVSDGCTTPSATAQTTITVNPLPVVTFSGQPLSGCAPLTVDFNNTTANSVDCLWDFGNGNTSTSCGPQVTEIFITDNCFDISLTVTDANGCSSTLVQPAYVCAFENVNVNFYASPQPTDIFEPTIEFTDNSSGNPNQWDWTFGPFGTSNSQNPIFNFPPETPGCYDVILTANNVNNCPDTDTIVVCINPNFSIYFPNAFTPNGDPYNNRFNAKGEGVVNFDMWIYDRWGNMVFHSTGLNDPWDGRMEGRDEICLDDVYVWKAKVIDIFNREHEYLGHVTLIR